MPASLLSTISFFMGLAIGSFLNVLIDRGVREESPRGRSYCESCKKILDVRELIPVASFLIQKRRCRSCRAPLSWQYPLVELGTGFLFSYAAWRFFALIPLTLSSLLVFLGVLLTAAAVVVVLTADLRYQIIPNGAALTLAITGLGASMLRAYPEAFFLPKTLQLLVSSTGLLSGKTSLWYDIGSALLISLFFAALWFFSGGRWMGFGDAKLIFSTSLLVGFPSSLSASLLSFWTGGIVGIILLGLKKKGLKSEMPFGPFILLGSILAYYYSPFLLSISGFSIFL